MSTGSYATLADSRPTDQVDAAWLSDLVRRPTAQLRVQQRFAIDEVGVEQARAVLLANRDAVTAVPVLFEILTACGFLAAGAASPGALAQVPEASEQLS